MPPIALNRPLAALLVVDLDRKWGKVGRYWKKVGERPYTGAWERCRDGQSLTDEGDGIMRGMFTPKLDDKSRLTLPAKYREELTDEVTVVCEQERCLAIYAKSVLDQMMSPVNAAPSTLRDVREYQRWTQYRAEDAAPDRQGRVTISAVQRQWAGLDKEVIVIGAGNRLEVWDPVKWEAYAAALDDKFADFDGEIVPRS